jgi:hypothetical protein
LAAGAGAGLVGGWISEVARNFVLLGDASGRREVGADGVS